MTAKTPIALFTYNRPIHTIRTIEALRANVGAGDSSLVVFSDGPRNEAATCGVADVRRYLKTVTGFRSVEVVERERNLGLAGSIIDGVTRLCAEYGRVIVVEDDMITSRWFLQYLNDGLDIYERDESVASIHAYVPPTVRTADQNFFLYGADCWGWATWQRAWKGFIADGQSLLDRLRKHPERRYFDYVGRWPYTRMLKGYMAGRNDSWAIRWHASMFLEGKVTLHPGRTLVYNIGLDGSGTHCTKDHGMNSDLVDIPVPVERMPAMHSLNQWRAFRRYYIGQLARRVTRKVIP